ncbi:hypothetical protein [Streptomyces griseoruber]|uniref:hypothetical protein n=1 Tax=Streptomyces griseoruber TaxID=1943 RepID=UPI000A714A00|nr:hypothetical protein [Streptomyces griseoruber]
MAEKRRTPGIEGSRPLGNSATPTAPWHTPPTWRRPCCPHQSRTRPEALPGHRRLEAAQYEGPAARIHITYDGPTTVTDPLVPGAREQYATVVLAWIGAGTWPQPAPSGPAPNSPPTSMR